MKTTLAHISAPLGNLPALGLFGGIAFYLLATSRYVCIRGGLGRGRPIAAAVSLGLLPPDGGGAWPCRAGIVAAVCVSLIAYEFIQHREERPGSGAAAGRSPWKRRSAPEQAAEAAVLEEGDELEIQPKQPTAKGSTDMFIGDVWLDVVARGEEPSRMRVSVVRFSPGSRNAWHAHAVGQTLHVTEGRGRVQARGGDIVEIRPGDTIYTPPGEWHWHGAASDHFMTHIAMWEAPADGPESEWGAHVTDAEYLGGNVR